MDLPPLLPARFLRRENRFLVTVERDGETVAAHLPNAGRLTELLTSGRRCWLSTETNPGRKTRHDLKLVEYEGTLVSVDSHLPNALVAEAFDAGRLPFLAGYDEMASEVALGASRIDFRLTGPAGVCWLEVKSVTLVEAAVAQFPDAPTERGSRHLRELVAAREAGGVAAVAFIVQRDDARAFRPRDETDPVFGNTLRAAHRAGVDVFAVSCRVSHQSVTLAAPLTVVGVDDAG